MLCAFCVKRNSVRVCVRTDTETVQTLPHVRSKQRRNITEASVILTRSAPNGRTHFASGAKWKARRHTQPLASRITATFLNCVISSKPMCIRNEVELIFTGSKSCGNKMKYDQNRGDDKRQLVCATTRRAPAKMGRRAGPERKMKKKKKK